MGRSSFFFRRSATLQPLFFMRLLPLVLAACLLTAGCDRFADEERGLNVHVVDASGAGVRQAEVHVVLTFDPPFALAASPPIAYATQEHTPVTARVFRRSDDREVLAEELGLVSPGEHTFAVAELRLPNGLYTLRMRAGSTLLVEEPFVLNRRPDRQNVVPPQGRTGADGRVTLSYEELSLGTGDVLLGSEASGKVAHTVSDTITLWVVPREGTPQGARVEVGPVGTTRATVTIE